MSADDKIQLSPQALQEMADVYAGLLKEQIRMGLDAKGRHFPPGVDLVQTGALINSIRGVVVDGIPMAEIGVPYAPYVNSRYPIDAICPQLQPELEKRLQPILDRGAYLASAR